MKQKVKDTLNALADQPEEHFAKLKEFYEEHFKDEDKGISLEEIIKYYKRKPESNLGITFKSLNKLALYLRKKAKSEEANEVYAAIATNTQENDFYRGFAYYQLEQYHEAAARFQKYLRKNPKHALSIKYLSRSKLAQLFAKAGTEKPRETDSIDTLTEQLATKASITSPKPKSSDKSQESEDADDEAEASSSSSPISSPKNISSNAAATLTARVRFEPFTSTPQAATAEKKERLRQVQTEMHFFSARRTYKTQTRDRAQAFQKNRQATTDEDVYSIEAETVPARRMITADVSTVQASLECFGHQAAHRGYKQSLLDWTIASRKSGKWQDELSAHTETITLGSIDSKPITYQYTHRLDTHHNHLGNFHSPSVGAYNAIYKQLAALAGSTDETPHQDNEKKIAQWMQRYATSGECVPLEALIEIYPNAKQNNLKNLMRIFFHCIIKEPMRWMMPMDGDHELPLATAQARAIKLIVEGHLSLKQVFDRDAAYGVFTDTNIGLDTQNVLIKINNINKLYAEKILLVPADSLSVTTRSQLHQELLEMYGGGSDRSSGPDTDGQGYDSETAHSSYPKHF